MQAFTHSSTITTPVCPQPPNSRSPILTFHEACSNQNGPENCQTNMVSLEGTLSNVNIYCLSTVGATNMLTQNGVSIAKYSDNVNVFPDEIALFQLASQTGPPGSNPPPTTTSTVPTTLSTKTSTAPTTSPTANGWTFLGCYTDSVSARTLLTQASVPGGAAAMTVEACQTACSGLGFVLAGVEYAQECCTSFFTPPIHFLPPFIS